MTSNCKHLLRWRTEDSGSSYVNNFLIFISGSFSKPLLLLYFPLQPSVLMPSFVVQLFAFQWVIRQKASNKREIFGFDIIYSLLSAFQQQSDTTLIIIKSVCYWVLSLQFFYNSNFLYRRWNLFTLDSQLGEFVLTHPNVRIPKLGNIYSCNEANRYKSVHLFVC